jgi:hypothetical protein
MRNQFIEDKDKGFIVRKKINEDFLKLFEYTDTPFLSSNSLTLNYLPKYNDNHQLINSVVYDDGSNVGIGTNSPISKLEVAGGNIVGYSGSSNTHTGIVVRNNNNASWTIDGRLTVDTVSTPNKVIIGSWTNHPLQIITNNTQRLWIDSWGVAVSGNLKVDGDVTITGNLSALGTTTQIETRMYVTSSVNIRNSGSDTALIVKQTGTQDIATFFDDNNVILSLKDGGNVGIGTSTSVNEKLTVVGGNISIDNNYGLKWSANTDTASIRFESTGDSVGLSKLILETTDNVDEPIVLRQSGLDRLYVGTGGNVGVGTNVPNEKLTIAGSISAVGNYITNTFSSTDTPAVGGLKGFRLVNKDTSPDSVGGIISDIADPNGIERHTGAIVFGRDGTWTSANYPGYVSLWTRPYDSSAEVERMRIDSTGNVGIGTTNTSSAKTTIFKSGGGNALYLNGTGFSTTPTSIIASTYDTVWTNGAPATIQFIDDGWFGNHIAFRTKITGAAGNADEERMRITTSGKVGIGINPTQRLHVVESGDGGANGTALFSSVGANASIRIDSASIAHNAYQTFSQGGVGKFELGINSGSDFYINPNVQSSSTGASIYVKKSDGNVGIGTTDPQGRLDVNGGFTIIRPTNDDPGGGHCVLFPRYGTDPYINPSRLEIRLYGTETNIYNHWAGTGVARNLTVGSGGAYHYYNGTTGNVGIGTTIPSQKLHVTDNTTTGDVRIALGTGVNALELIRNGASGNWVRSFGGDFFIDQYANNSLTFRTNASPRMTILGGGSVLINTSTTDDATLKLDVDGRGRFAALTVGGKLSLNGLPTYSNNINAKAGGLIPDDVYKTSTGELRIVI